MTLAARYVDSAHAGRVAADPSACAVVLLAQSLAVDLCLDRLAEDPASGFFECVLVRPEVTSFPDELEGGRWWLLLEARAVSSKAPKYTGMPAVGSVALRLRDDWLVGDDLGGLRARLAGALDAARAAVS